MIAGLPVYQFIAEPVDRPYLYVGPCAVKFLPEILHLRIDELEVVRLVDMISPHSFRKHSLVHDMFRALDEILQNVELFLQQQDILPRYRHPPRIRL